MKRILFPTDFSLNSSIALKYATGLCRLFNCELIILHACHIGAFAYQLLDEELNEEKVIETAKADLDKYCDSNLSILNDIKVKRVIEYGLAGDVISKFEKESEADLIVMGTKGMKGLDEFLIGSNTMSVINKVDSPVLAIPENSKLKTIKKIAFATDYRENEIDSLKFLIELAKKFEAEITILHVADFIVSAAFDDALFEIYKSDVKENITYEKVSFHVLKGISHSKALNDFIMGNKFDLLAISTRKKDLLTRIFSTSFTKKMLYHLEIPLLAFHTSHKKSGDE